MLILRALKERRDKRAPPALKAERSAGFIAIDAMIGLSLIGLVLALSFLAGHTALRLGARARAVEDARSRLIGLLETPAPAPSAMSGTAPGLTWTRTTQKDAAASGLCLTSAIVRLDHTRLVYTAASLRPCAEAQG